MNLPCTNRKALDIHITFTVDEETYNKLVKQRDITGIPVSKQLELMTKGYRIVKDNEN